MNIDQITKTKEIMNHKIDSLNKTFPFDHKEEFFFVSRFIQFIDENPILNKIILEEKHKYNKGGIEKENLYKDYLFICDRLPFCKYNDYPDVYYSSITLYNKLLSILHTIDINLSLKPDNLVNPNFDTVNKLLYIHGEKPININKQAKISNQFILLEYIFQQELGIEISYKEILENAFENDKVNCTVACRDINENILKQTDSRINEFLKYSTTKNGYVKINPKYLSPN